MTDRAPDGTPAPPRSNAETMRRAIRAVAVAQQLVADTRVSQARRDVDRRARTGQPTPEQSAEAATATLRATVEAYVREMREAGELPERVVVSLRTDLQAAATPGKSAGERELLLQAAVGWGIEEYFRRA